jgi:hypothetical protein
MALVFARSTAKMMILRNMMLSPTSREVKGRQRSSYATASNSKSVEPSLKLSGRSENLRHRSGTSGWMQFVHKSIDTEQKTSET